MTAPTLPILIPGRSEPVHVPFALEAGFSFSVDVFLPERGVRRFCVTLTSRDLAEAEVDTVELDRPPGAFPLLHRGNQRAADEAAGDVLDTVVGMLGVRRDSGEPVAPDVRLDPFSSPRTAIARAYLAEVAAYEANVAAHASLPRALHSPVILGAPPDVNPYSAARTMLALYVEWCFEEAQKAQADKARRLEASWEPPPRHPEDETLPPWTESH